MSCSSCMNSIVMPGISAANVARCDDLFRVALARRGRLQLHHDVAAVLLRGEEAELRPGATRESRDLRGSRHHCLDPVHHSVGFRERRALGRPVADHAAALVHLGQEARLQPEVEQATRQGERELAKVFQTDPLVCERCGGPLKVVAYITDSLAIRQTISTSARPRNRLPRPATSSACRSMTRGESSRFSQPDSSHAQPKGWRRPKPPRRPLPPPSAADSTAYRSPQAHDNLTC
jgi:hypothetical protein